VSTKPAFAEYPLRYSINLVELGARFIFLVDLEFSELRCLVEKKLKWSYFLNLEQPSQTQHALRACLGELHAAQDPQKQLLSIFFLPNTTAPKTPDPPNPWI
jgi:hypothetical protein